MLSTHWLLFAVICYKFVKTCYAASFNFADIYYSASYNFADIYYSASYIAS